MSHPNRLSDMNPARLEPEGDGAAAEYTAALHHIRYQSDDGTYVVADFITHDKLLFTAVGNISGFDINDHVLISGEWIESARYGKQLRVHYIQPHFKPTPEGIKIFLANKITFIGAKMAEKIVDLFGVDTIRILDQTPERLKEVPGIGKKKQEKISKSWQNASFKRLQHRNLTITFQSLQIGPSLSERIINHFGDNALNIVRSDPFSLAGQIEGIGFQLADRIARQVGIPLDAPKRIDAGIEHVINEAENSQGHCYLPVVELLSRSAQLLQISPEDAAKGVARLIDRHIIRQEIVGDRSTIIMRSKTHSKETKIAEYLKKIFISTETPSENQKTAIPALIRILEQQFGINLSGTQRQAIELSFLHPLIVVTGGPGTGKTTLVRILVAACEHINLPVFLAAPTGRAAKRLSEATGTDALTLHRLLEFSFEKGGFQRNQNNRLDSGLFVIDEASMIDLSLMHSFLRALPENARLVIVGDIDQLPSIGPGAILSDLITSNVVRFVRLDNIFRQVSESFIIRNAHKINHGEMPIFPERNEAETADFFMLFRNSSEVERTIVSLVCDRLPKRYHFDPLKDIQVLCPMRVREIGSESINLAIQATINPSGHPLNRSPHAIRVGDRVMQLRNNYEKDVYNGDVGRVLDWNEFDKRALISFDDRDVTYSTNELSELTLAYASTVHKAQGSEYPAVIIPLVRQHHVMLQRNLLYTALTRARRLVVLVGDISALRIAVNNDQPKKRYTRLAHRLRDCLISSEKLEGIEENPED